MASENEAVPGDRQLSLITDDQIVQQLAEIEQHLTIGRGRLIQAAVLLERLRAELESEKRCASRADRFTACGRAASR